MADVDASISRGVAAGATVAATARSLDFSRVAAIIDPQGAAIGLAVFLQNPRQALDFGAVSILYLFGYWLLTSGTLPPISHPTQGRLWVYLGVNFSVLLIVTFPEVF